MYIANEILHACRTYEYNVKSVIKRRVIAHWSHTVNVFFQIRVEHTYLNVKSILNKD